MNMSPRVDKSFNVATLLRSKRWCTPLRCLLLAGLGDVICSRAAIPLHTCMQVTINSSRHAADATDGCIRARAKFSALGSVVAWGIED